MLKGYLVEALSIIMFIVTAVLFVKRNSLKKAITFFLPLFVIGLLSEGLFIKLGEFKYLGFNIFVFGVPLAIVLYWTLFYYLYLLYQFLGKGLINRLKGVLIHLVVDTLVTTPLAIILGYWTFRYTLFSHYPFISPLTHLGEVVAGLFYTLLQEKQHIK